MLLQGDLSSEKTQKLVENYAGLLNSGVDSSKILVILQNSNKKEKFIQETLEKLTVDSIEKLQIYSFFGLVYNTIMENWASIENKIPDEANTKIIPNLTGLEVSQFIMREIIADIKFEGYNSKKSLLHQLFRRYSLIVQNNLSDEDVKWRSEEVLRESFAPDAKNAIDEFKKKTLEARALDYLRQSLIFNYIYQTTDYFSQIEYIFVDDGDEITPICFDFLKFMAPKLKDVFIAYDEIGSSRSGYLSADKNAGVKFKKLFIKPLTLNPSPSRGEGNSVTRFYSLQTLNQAKALRKDTTDAEQLMWFLLRDRNFCGLKFRRQAPIGKYIVDFICLEKKLIIELDGSGHLQENQIKHDAIRQDYIEGEGYKIIRLFNNDVFNNLDGALEKIYQEAILSEQAPSPLGGEGRGEGFISLLGNSTSANAANTLFDNVIEQKNSKINNFSLFSFSKRAQMIDIGVNEISLLIERGMKPSEIAIITPIVDDMLRFSLKEKFKNSWANALFLSGSEKIIQNPIVLASLTILKICDNELKKDLSEFDVRAILDFLQIPLKHCKEILQEFEKSKTFIDFEFKVLEYSEKYKKFLELLNILSDYDKLSGQVFEIWENFVDIQNYTPEEITKFNFFIKQLEDFENVFVGLEKSEIINQIENSIISENPYSTLEIRDNDLVIATPQKIIDNQIRTKYQFWFDVSSDEWIKNDTGPLYNAWVFQADWDKPEYTLQDNIELSRQKTARILRKLALCSKEKISAYASLFDGSGIENFGGIEKYLSHGNEIKTMVNAKPIIPRDDQKLVLDYNSGTMAISAVPGAGKTTILLALIIKLLNNGINPENIFVLTYMESAARNFRERIQNANQEYTQLPNISTIHGLALKILKENANYEKLGLLELTGDFEICDDTQRSRILRELASKFDIKKTELDDFDRAVSVLKIGGGVNISAPSPPTPLPSSERGESPNLVGSDAFSSEKNERTFSISPCHYSQKILNQAKELRKNQTEPEEIMWFLLRDKRFCDLKFKRQVPFGKYIADFICLEKKLIIELDGSQHLQENNLVHDEKRREYIENEGYKVVRFYNSEIFNNLESVLEKIYQEIFAVEQSPSPLRGEGLGERVFKKAPAENKKLAKFLEFFNEYKSVLQQNNLIDYDDMLLFSVKLLEENPDVLKYYQDICQYIIEDEAQDSSAIQQRLIELLSAKHKNLIRCGDINQAITTTFSNADVEGFRKFIETSKTRVSMDRSQRCTKDVWTLANTLVLNAELQPETKNAFYKIFMRPVEGKNPEIQKGQKAIRPVIFENEFVEKNYILKQIKEIITKDPKTTVGILLRSNYQVASWTKFVNNSGMKAITRSECLEQKGIFRTIFAILKIILNPFDNENIAQNYEILADLGHCKSNLYQEIKNCSKPFIQMNVDEMNNVGLENFYWDVIYWLSFSSLAPEELAIKIGLHYYGSDIEKSNVYLISTLIKRLGISYKKYSTMIERLGELSKKPNLSGFKFFGEEDQSDREFLQGKVQVMTLHKSKGDEFDVVFLPEMAEKNLPLSFENVSLKKNARFMEDVRELNPNYPAKTDDELKEFLLAENLRLFYVAVTRAKKKLFITTNKSAKYNKVPEPSVIFEQLGVG